MPESPSFDGEEASPENLPSQENIEEFFRDFLEGKEYRIVTNVRDEQGISRFEIEVLIDGGKMEYNYQKARYDHAKSSVPTGAQFPASIHSLIYHGEDIVGGKCIANFLDGVWAKRPLS